MRDDIKNYSIFLYYLMKTILRRLALDNSGGLKPNEPINLPKTCLFWNYETMIARTNSLIDRTMERPTKWYFIVAKPFNSTYVKHHDWYQSKALDHVRRKVGKSHGYIITKEQESKNVPKTHINVLVASDRDLCSILHEKKDNKFFYYCQECIDRKDIQKYILKESKERQFMIFKDYRFFCPGN